MTTAPAFPETKRAWARLMFNLRSSISVKLLSLAMDASPRSERLSLAVAVRDHLERVKDLDG